MAGAETRRINSPDFISEPLEVSVNRHSLYRLQKYAEEARRYFKTIEPLADTTFPARFVTAFADEVATDVSDARRSWRLFHEIYSDLTDSKNVRIISSRSNPPLVTFDLSSHSPGMFQWKIIENLIKVLFPPSSSGREIREESGDIREALEKGRSVVMLSPKKGNPEI